MGDLPRTQVHWYKRLSRSNGRGSSELSLRDGPVTPVDSNVDDQIVKRGNKLFILLVLI